jgi:hypothetical protein
MIICVLAAIGAIKEGLTALAMQGSSNILRIPKFPFLWITAFGFFTVAFVIVVIVLHDRRKKPSAESSEEEGYTV